MVTPHPVPPAAKKKLSPARAGRTALFVLLAGLLWGAGAGALPLRAGGLPTRDELLGRYRQHRAEFQRLAALLKAQDGRVFGRRYGEYRELKEALGLRTFAAGTQGKVGLRFPVAYSSDVFQLGQGRSLGYAWLSGSPSFVQAVSDDLHRNSGEPPARFVVVEPAQALPPLPPTARRQYAIVLQPIEGAWYLYLDNGLYHAGW